MDTFVLIIHILVSVFLIGTVLLQAGKGASIGASFGGSNQTLFGSSGGSFMGKLTAGVAIIFMLTSLTLAYISATSSTSSIMKDVESVTESVPAQPAGNEVAPEDAVPAGSFEETEKAAQESESATPAEPAK